MLRNSEKGFAHLLLIALLVIGIAVGVYVVQKNTNLIPHAQVAAPQFKTGFSLAVDNFAPPPPPQSYPDDRMNNTNSPSDSTHINSETGSDSTVISEGNGFYPGDIIPVQVLVRSDVDSAKKFHATINFPKDLLEVSDIQPASGSGQLCAQVHIRACHSTGCEKTTQPYACDPVQVCQDFPTPCDVPPNWVVSSSTSQTQATVSGTTVNISTSQSQSKSQTVQNTNTNNYNIKYPPNSSNYFIKNWTIQNYNNDLGQIILEGNVPQGFKTDGKNPSSSMATIYFRAKKEGNAQLVFDNSSSMTSDDIVLPSQNMNLTINIQSIITPAPSVAPIPSLPPLPTSSPPQTQTSLKAVNQFYLENPAGGLHYYSTEDSVAGWTKVGVAFYAYDSPQPGTKAVDHFVMERTKGGGTNQYYAVNDNPAGWTNKGAVFYAYDSPQPGTKAVNQFYLENAAGGLHYYSIQDNPAGWTKIGPAFYAYETPLITSSLLPSPSANPSSSPSCPDYAIKMCPNGGAVVSETDSNKCPIYSCLPGIPTPPTPPNDTLLGDLNHDKKIDIFDINKFISNWASANKEDDFNNDGKVDLIDFNILFKSFQDHQ